MSVRRALIAVGLVAGALAFVPSGNAKPRDGIPAWVETSATRTLSRVFGNPTVKFPRDLASKITKPAPKEANCGGLGMTWVRVVTL